MRTRIASGPVVRRSWQPPRVIDPCTHHSASAYAHFTGLYALMSGRVSDVSRKKTRQVSVGIGARKALSVLYTSSAFKFENTVKKKKRRYFYNQREAWLFHYDMPVFVISDKPDYMNISLVNFNLLFSGKSGLVQAAGSISPSSAPTAEKSLHRNSTATSWMCTRTLTWLTN